MFFNDSLKARHVYAFKRRGPLSIDQVDKPAMGAETYSRGAVNRNALPSNNPRSLNFRKGITRRAIKERVI